MERNIYKIENNLYVTSDEEFIEEGDYGIDLDDNSLFKCKSKYGEEFTSELLKNGNLRGLSDYDNCRKIILTTDQILIKDGVQAIDDEFLEWFVENPSCEFVEVSELRFFNPDTNESIHCKWEYDLPKEEPKQEKKPHSFCETPKEKCTMNYCDDNGCQNRKRHLVEPHEQETLEEAAKKYAELSYYNGDEVNAFVNGVKWQYKRSYSEEEVRQIVEWSFHFYKTNEFDDSELEEEWYKLLEERFKKK